VKLIWIVLSVMLLGAVMVAMRHAEPNLALMLNAAFALLVSPTSWSHHWVWVAPALLVMLTHAARRLSAGWLLAFALTSALFSLSPFQRLPGFDDVELTWTPWQQLVGALYPLVTAALVVGFAVHQFRRPPLEPPRVSAAQHD
jgi:alpha-1,2-mannosyltransferase